jgi:nucleoredoxin
MDQLLSCSPDLQLLAQGGATTPVSALADTQVVGLYFSAHWCPPCRGFTPKLAEAYTAIKGTGKSLEIVFVSSDRDEVAFDSYHKEMPWLALPFAERALKQTLSKRFKVSGIPSLVLLDGATGQVLSKDGRSVIMSDPQGADFPWAPKTRDELLGEVLLDGQGAELPRAATLKDKHVALYFSAHWCPPCQRFTPELAETYKAIKAARDDFELVFVSGDRDAAQFREYFATMPWLALPFEEKRYEALSSHFEVEGIPTLVLLSPEGKVITTKGRAAVSADPEGKDFPNWGAKPVSTLEQAAGDLNESPALIVLCEKASAEEKSAIAMALKAPADAIFAAAVAADAEPEMVFAIGEAAGDIADQVRRLTKLEESKGVAMVLLDIPDNGAYYVWQRPEGAGEIAVTEADVSKFVADYRAKSLQRLQLS